jgi:hypothetical protein
MQRIVCILLTLCFGCMSYCQYTVTKVIGEVTNKTSGEFLRPGSKLRDEDMLAFSSSTDMLRVIVSGKGIYVISPGPKSEKQQNVIVEMLKSALKIKSKEGYLSGRSEEDELIPGVLKTDAALNINNLVRTENKYLFDPRTYNVSPGNGSRFFLQTEIPGSKPVIRPLKTIADTLFIYAADFEKGGTSFKMGFFSKEKNSSQLLAEISPRADTSDEAQTIIKLIIAENKGTAKNQLERTCYAEVYEALGKPSIIFFNQLFDKFFSEVSKNAN